MLHACIKMNYFCPRTCCAVKKSHSNISYVFIAVIKCTEINCDSFLPRCAVITEFARDLLAQRGVKLVVPGEQDRVVVSLEEGEEEKKEEEEEKNGAEEPVVTANVGEKCEVCWSVRAHISVSEE